MNSVPFRIDTSDACGLIYKRFFYPAGEMQVRLQEKWIPSIQSQDRVVIVARLQSANNIIELALLHDAVREVCLMTDRQEPARVQVIIPYWPYARADRRFVAGDSFGLQVFSRLLSSVGTTIWVLDVHSSRALSLVDNNWVHSRWLRNVTPEKFISWAIKDFSYLGRGRNPELSARGLTILFPDAGARTRYQLPSAARTGVGPLTFLHAEKMRDAATGALSGFKVPERAEFPDQPVLIVDDICDGGGTFLGIADAMAGYQLPLGLYVTHGIFSKGLRALEDRFRRVYTTNSFQPYLVNVQAQDQAEEAAREEFLVTYDCIPEIIDQITW